jgi:fucose permease
MKIITTAASYMSLLAYGILITIPGPVMMNLEQEFLVTSSQSGLIFTAISGGFLLAIALSPVLYKRVHNKIIAVGTLLLLVASLILLFAVESFSQFTFVYFVIGILGGFLQITANSTVAHIYSHEAPAALNILHTFFGIGAVAGPLISGYFAQVNWRYPYLISAGAVFLSLILAFFSRYTFHEEKEKDDGPLFLLIKDPVAILLFFAAMFYVGTEMGITSWAVTYIRENSSASMMSASSYMSWFWGAMTIGRLLVAWLNKHFSSSRILLVLAGGALGSYGFFLLHSQAFSMGVGMALTGLFFSGIFPQLMGMGSERYGDHINRVTILFMTALGAGFMIFPWLMGMMKSAFSLQFSMRSLIVLLTFLFFFTGVLWRKTRSS